MRIGRWSLVVVVTLGCLGSLACGRDDGEARNQVQSLSATDGGPRFSYYGGHLLANVEVVQVVWGPPIAGRQGYVPGVEGTVYPNMATFYQAAVTSSYLDWIGEEYGVPSQPIGRGSGPTLCVVPTATAVLRGGSIAVEGRSGNLRAPARTKPR